MVIPGKNAENRLFCFFLDPADTLFKKMQITPETIDDKSLNLSTLFRLKAFKGADDLVETSSSPSPSDVDPAADDGEIAPDAEDTAPDALPAFLSETAA